MTPPRARKLAACWTIATVAICTVLLATSMIGLRELSGPLAMIGIICMSRVVDHLSWARGYEDALKREAN